MTTKNNTVLQFALCVFEGFEHDTLHSSVVNDTLASDDKLSLLTVREAYAELRRVTWPTREQTIQYTTLVIIISLLTAAILGTLDYIFGGLVGQFLLK